MQAFPLAYKEMSEREFKGDFLAVVQREDELDSPLAQAFARGWRKTGSDEEIDKKMGLINFVFSNSTFSSSSPAAIHFLRSEQTPFWNHFVPQMRRLPAKQKELPALLITDTGFDPHTRTHTRLFEGNKFKYLKLNCRKVSKGGLCS
jgi:hypothetical protein